MSAQCGQPGWHYLLSCSSSMPDWLSTQDAQSWQGGALQKGFIDYTSSQEEKRSPGWQKRLPLSKQEKRDATGNSIRYLDLMQRASKNMCNLSSKGCRIAPSCWKLAIHPRCRARITVSQKHCIWWPRQGKAYNPATTREATPGKTSKKRTVSYCGNAKEITNHELQTLGKKKRKICENWNKKNKIWS